MSTYDADFYAWTQEQAAALRDKDLGALDLAHLAEEIDTLGRSERKTLRSDLRRLLCHLLKWQYQPEYRSRSWQISIVQARGDIDDDLADDPSCAPSLPSSSPKPTAVPNCRPRNRRDCRCIRSPTPAPGRWRTC